MKETNKKVLTCDEVKKLIGDGDHLAIPEGYTKIEEFALYGCTGIFHIEIPASITSIDRGALNSCPLIKISVDTGNMHYSSQEGVLFNKDKTKLIKYPRKKEQSTYIIPAGVTEMSEDAFDFCETLKQVTLPKGITTIENGAFAWCRNLSLIEIPDTVEYIDRRELFIDCPLTKISVDSRNMNYLSQEGVLFNKDVTELIKYPPKKEQETYIIPAGVTEISDNAFSRCEALKQITLPKGITTINEGAFEYCINLSQIEIPDTVQYIDDGAFTGCNGLIEIILPSSIKEIGFDAFGACRVSWVEK